MLRDVIEKELKDCVYAHRSVLVFILSTVLFGISIYTGSREYQAGLQEFRLAQAAHRRQIAGPANLYALGNFGFDLVKPPQALGILVSGVDPHAPRVYNLALFTLPEPRGSVTSQSPTSAVFGVLDLLFIVQVVLGLAALLFTFSTICGEKESGTLKLQLANALPKDVLLSGKLVGNLIGLLVPVALAFLLGGLLLINFDGISLTGGDVLRILLLGINFLLYLTVLFALGIFVSTLTPHSTTAFGLCLIAWVLLVAIVPKFAVLAAKQISPLESLQGFELKKVEVHRQGSVEAQQEYDKYLLEHHREVPPVGIYFEMTRRIREKQNLELSRLEDDYLHRKQRQEWWAQMLARSSPAGSMSYAAMSLARTGLERDFRFQAAMRDYRSEFTRYYDEKSHEQAELAENRQGNSSAVYQNLSDLPEFEFHEEPLASSLEKALPDLGFLALWILALFVAAYVSFLGYDVR
jgi:ABC-type transport system involved in multi-copper enzyme maturation permease subunit